MFSLLFLAKPTVLLQIDVFCGSRAEVVLRPIFVTWLCRACTRTRGLISLKFSRPGTVCTLFCGSRADVVLRQYLFPDSVARVRTRGLNFITPWSCLQFVGNCSFRAEVFSWQFFLPESVERFIQLYYGEQGWRSGESTRLPPMSPGFESRTRRHMWVEFVVSSLLCSERFFSGYSGFPLSAKTNISKFQFDPECSSV